MLVAACLAWSPTAAATRPSRSPAAAVRRPPVNMMVDDLRDSWALQRLKEGGVRLEASSNAFTSVDVETRIPRSADAPGIGMALEEFGSDGTHGLVLVDFLVEGGNAADASKPILAGDALITVAPASKAWAKNLEGLTYDDTIEVLSSIDPAEGELVLTVRRLQKLPTVSVTLSFPDEGREDENLTLIPGQPLRSTMLAKGIKLNDPLARRFDAGYGTGDCGGEGCCCTCALEVVTGLEVLNEQKSQERQMLRKHPDWRLACRARVSEELACDAELVLRVSPRAWEPEVVDECLAEEA